ncbi:MAG: RidA family protein [Candidatus Hydrogenedentes bacterium]|nr:RidA family protein [Candidatus Hydrogenedentota bacterium]
MQKECIFSPNGSPAGGPYSHAVRAGNLLFVSGQGPMAKDGSGVVPGTLEEETHLTLDNLRAVLEDAGSGLEHVIKTTCFLKDMNNFKRFNAVYSTYFTENPPARSCVEVARLPLDFQVEVEAVAIIPEA